MLNSNKLFFLVPILIIILLVYSRNTSSEDSTETEFQSKLFVRKHLTAKLDSWKAWESSWYGLYPQNKASLFEDSNAWKKARLINYEIIIIKSNYSSAFFSVVDRHSLSAVALVKVELLVNKQEQTRFIEYHFYKKLDTKVFDGLDWRVTDTFMYDGNEIKEELKWSNSALTW